MRSLGRDSGEGEWRGRVERESEGVRGRGVRERELRVRGRGMRGRGVRGRVEG